MGSKINRICELSAEVGKATLIMADKDNRIAEMSEYTEKQAESLHNLERTSAHVIEQNEKLLAVLTDLEEKLKGKNEVIDILSGKIDITRKDSAALRKQLKALQVHEEKKPMTKPVEKKDG